MTKISWTDKTWNPTVGCARVSKGCRNCYAEHAAAMVNRTQGEKSPYRDLVKLTGGTRRDPQWNGKAKFLAERLAIPLGWRRPVRVFVDSMSDLFHKDISNEQIAAVFGVMAATPRHTYQILTKRPERMVEWFQWARGAFTDQQRAIASAPNTARAMLDAAAEYLGTKNDTLNTAWRAFEDDAWPLPNVHIGVSVEDQERADERIPLLLQAPAAVRFLSCEPLLGPLDLSTYLWRGCSRDHGGCGQMWPRHQSPPCSCARPWEARGLGWLIAGCESGHGARPCEVEWLRSLRDQCGAAAVPFFLKQAWSYSDEPSAQPHGVTAGEGSHWKGGHVIELPYLDDVQHAAFPEVPHVG